MGAGAVVGAATALIGPGLYPSDTMGGLGGIGAGVQLGLGAAILGAFVGGATSKKSRLSGAVVGGVVSFATMLAVAGMNKKK